MDTVRLQDQDFNNLYDIYNKLDSRAKEAEGALTQKAQFTEQFARTYRELEGKDVTPKVLEEAIEKHMQEHYAFKQPDGLLWASAWINRGKIGLGAAALGLVAVAGIGINTVVESSKVHKAQTDVEDVYKWEQNLDGAIAKFKSDPTYAQLPATEQADFNQFLAKANADLALANDLLGKFCPSGKADMCVTNGNYSQVEEKLKPIKDDLTTVMLSLTQSEDLLKAQKSYNTTKNNLDALITSVRKEGGQESYLQEAESAYLRGGSAITRRDLDAAQAEEANLQKVIQQEKTYTSTRAELTSLIADVRSSQIEDSFKARAEKVYETGIRKLDQRKLDEALEQKDKLVHTRNDLNVFVELSNKLEPLYQEVQEVAKENAAQKKADELYGSAKASLKAANVPELQKAVQDLQTLASTLNQEYTLTIVSKPGHKSGIDRYYEDENGKRVSGFYIIVEALDQNGRALTMPITNAENNRVENVAEWGERVPQEVYKRVGQDKKDDGIIQKNKVAEKKRGYLNPQFDSSFKVEDAKITRW